MHTAYLVITLLFALMVSYSGVGKIRRDPLQVRVVHETVGLPLKYFPLLAACEFAGAVGLALGIWGPPHHLPARDAGRESIRHHVGAARGSAGTPRRFHRTSGWVVAQLIRRKPCS